MNVFYYLPLKDRRSASIAGNYTRNAGRSCRPHAQPMRAALGDRGFTAIELLVVIALLAILTTMLLPALLRGSGRALTAQCLNNKRQLAIARHVFDDQRLEAVREDERHYLYGCGEPLGILR